MRIDGTFGYDAYGMAGKGRSPGQGPAKVPRAIAAQVGVEVADSTRKYIDQAAATPAVDSSAVEEARKLLASGLLDTPEAIDRVAQAIVDKGL